MTLPMSRARVRLTLSSYDGWIITKALSAIQYECSLPSRNMSRKLANDTRDSLIANRSSNVLIIR